MLDTSDLSYKTLFTSDDYSKEFDKITFDYFSEDFFKSFYPADNTEYSSIVPGYLSSTASLYRNWSENSDPDKGSIEDLARFTAEVLSGGLKKLVDE